MANKINAKLILELKVSGLLRNQIVATRRMSKHSVSDVINIAKEKGIIYNNLKTGVDHIRKTVKSCLYRTMKHLESIIQQLSCLPVYESLNQQLKIMCVFWRRIWQKTVPFVLLNVMYWGTNILMTFGSVKNEKKQIGQVLLPIILFLLHIAYGVGTLVGLIQMPFKRKGMFHSKEGDRR